jgi:hypothetical protein
MCICTCTCICICICICICTCQVVRQYQRRDALVQELLAEAEAGRARGGQEAAALGRAVKEREAAQRAASRAQVCVGSV